MSYVLGKVVHAHPMTMMCKQTHVNMTLQGHTTYAHGDRTTTLNMTPSV